MSTTIVFACKSNSCRSQIAEGWARDWMAKERDGIEKRKLWCTGADDVDMRLAAFLDSLLVVSVALDESSVVDANDTRARQVQCVTCDGEACTSAKSRRKPKEKAIQAMAQDGVDIRNYYAKTINEILPLILSPHQRLQKGGRKSLLSFAGMYRALEIASREIGMAFAGIAREDGNANEKAMGGDRDGKQAVDSFIVLCSCHNSMKRELSGISNQTLEWAIDPPSSMVKSEGDGAYLRVSRQIRAKVTDFLDELKRSALSAGADDVGLNVTVRCDIDGKITPTTSANA